jgi:DNA-binding GntR family transcriptional regulator
MEKDLAERLGVSRTPVREALRKLEIEGFVDMVPRKGAIVKQVTAKEIADVLEIRAVLESFAAKTACRCMDEEQKALLELAKEAFNKVASEGDVDKMADKDMEFHGLIYAAAKNDRLTAIINNLGEQIYRYRVTYLYDKKYIKTIISEHDGITQAIFKNDEDKAALIAAEHIANQQRAIVGAIK